MNNNNKITYLFGSLLIAIGVIFIISPTGVFETIAFAGGTVLIIFSALGLIVSIFGKGTLSQYYIASTIIGLIFGIILINNTDSAIKIIPVLLGIWLFISGLSTTIAMSKSGSKLISMTTPITRIILGLVCLLTPVIPIVITGIFIGIILILSGINTITNAKNEETIYKVKIKK